MFMLGKIAEEIVARGHSVLVRLAPQSSGRPPAEDPLASCRCEFVLLDAHTVLRMMETASQLCEAMAAINVLPSCMPCAWLIAIYAPCR